MADHLKEVQTGDPSSPRLRRAGPLRAPAAAYRLFVDAARDFRERVHGLAQGAMLSFAQAMFVPVRNTNQGQSCRFAGVRPGRGR